MPEADATMLNIRARLHTLEHQHPEWRSWLALCEETLRELEAPVWRAMEINSRPEPTLDAPLLDGRELIVDSAAVRGWINRLGKRLAVSQTAGDALYFTRALKRIDVGLLLSAAVRQDLAWIQTQASAVGVDVHAMQTLAELGVTPLLYECRRRSTDQTSVPWTPGYCPVCGAWPVLAEVRGVERTRYLRCGRCGGSWRTAWLRCPFCGETSHEHLAFLILDGKEETPAVATCSQCQGYIKTLTVLHETSSHTVMLDDVATVELDVAALDRGYVRPSRPGYGVHLRITERTRSWSSFLRRSS